MPDVTAACQTLHDLGQSLWLDYITRSLLNNGGLETYLKQYAVTGLTSNPTIFAKAFKQGDYTAAIVAKRQTGRSDEEIFFELACEDLGEAAKIFGRSFSAQMGSMAGSR